MAKKVETKPALTVHDVLAIIGDGHEFFSVTFTKRTNGEIRTLNCRRKVQSHLKGGQAAYNFTEKKLISVWSANDVGAHGANDTGYRSIPVETISEIKCHGRRWIVKNGIAKEMRR